MGDASVVDTEKLCELIEILYGIPQRHGDWSDFMATFCRYLAAESASLRFYTSGWSKVVVCATHGFEPESDRVYREHFVHVDPIPSVIESLRMPPGEMALLDEALPFRELKRTEFYNDFLRPNDKRHIMGGYLHYEDGDKAIFGVQRSHCSAAFGVDDQRVLRTLAPHFQQVLRLNCLLNESRALAGAMTRAFDSLEIAALFLDRTGKVRFANAQAEQLLQSGRVVRMRKGHLHASRREQDIVLQRTIEAVIGASVTEDEGAGSAFQLGDTQPMKAIIVPWCHASAFDIPMKSSIVAAVFLGAGVRPSLKTQYLSDAYGLTRTEARLAAKLVETCSLREATESIGVTRQTGRDYLKAIFRKTDCHSQAEFISTILTAPPGLWGRKNRVKKQEQYS